MTKHAVLGPSSAERWMNCPGSVALCANCPPAPANIYAAEGTVAHRWAEQLVSENMGELELLALVGTKDTAEGFDIEITREMVEGIQLYRDTIRGDRCELELGPGAIHEFSEMKVQDEALSAELWGTADYLMNQCGHKLVVYDFKYGKKPVEVTGNKQLAIYALGAQKTLKNAETLKVELVIVQPRGEHVDGPVRRWNVPVGWLEDFREKVKKAIAATKTADAALVPGEHCRWCPAKAQCPALYAVVQKTAGADFDVVPHGLPEVRQMSVEKLAQAYLWRDTIDSWFSAVADRMQDILSSGGKVPGFKLVNGRSNRKWISEEAVVEEWEEQLPPGALFKHTLLSPAELEKLPEVGKGKIDHLTFKPVAKKAIARDIDPRPKVASAAQDDFAVIDGGMPPKRDELWPL